MKVRIKKILLFGLYDLNILYDSFYILVYSIG